MLFCELASEVEPIERQIQAIRGGSAAGEGRDLIVQKISARRLRIGVGPVRAPGRPVFWPLCEAEPPVLNQPRARPARNLRPEAQSTRPKEVR
jgi:hypothetical protein